MAGPLGTMPAMDAPPLGLAEPTPAPLATGDDRRGEQDLGPGPVVADDPEGPPFGRAVTACLRIGAVLAVAGALVLRFWTRSDLWLDEALTVNIARLPLHELPSFLRRDGAPPLYYVLLHYWMDLFGTSDRRRPLALRGHRRGDRAPRLAGRKAARGEDRGLGAMFLVATSPFAVRYDTEARMYSLVALLTLLGFLALDRSLRRPRAGNLIAVGAVSALLLYTHYWSIYLLATTLAWLVWQGWRGRPAWRVGARASVVALLVGCLAFLPWVPTFVFQSLHTGTPWATPATFAAMVNAVASFAGGSTSQGRALALLFFALAGLGLFGLATDRRHIELDIRTRPLGRPAAVVVVGTLAAAVIGGLATNSAFDARYASVVFIPLILLVSLGLTVFRDRRVRVGVLAAAMVLGLAASVPNVTTNRTQAGQVAAAIAATGRPGDIVAYCPDQLGPAVDRLLPAGRYVQITFPRGSGAEFVNWVDYADAVRAASPLAFAQHVEALAAGRQIFVVWAPQYQAYGVKCEGIVQTLQNDPHYQYTSVVVGNSNSFYQPMWMVRLSPTGT